jgi:hypothetical protein
MSVIAIYASYIVGLVRLKYLHLLHHVGFGCLLIGVIGDKIFAAAFVAFMTLTVGSHSLTGRLHFRIGFITRSNACGLVFSVVSSHHAFCF